MAALAYFILLIVLPCLVILLFPVWIARSRRADAASRSSDTAAASLDIVIPLAPREEHLEAHARSYLAQRHPAPIQVLFVAEQPEHPSARCIAGMLPAAASVQARLLFSGDPGPAVAKMHNLQRAVKECRHDCIVLLDSDVLLPRADQLSRAVTALHDASVGLVTAAPLYHDPRTVGGHLLATMINADVWGYFASLSTIGSLNVANGSLIAMRRETLRAIGDFADLQRKILNDSAIAQSVRALGLRIHLSAEPAHIPTPRASIADWWRQAMRWHIGMRSVLPRTEYLLFGLLRVPTLAGLTAYFLFVDSPLRLAFPVVPVAARSISLALIVGYWYRDFSLIRQLAIVPLTDLVSPLLWLLAWVARTISWRGRRYRVAKDGIADALG